MKKISNKRSHGVSRKQPVSSKPQSQWWSRWRYWKGEGGHLKLSQSALCSTLANSYLDKGLKGSSHTWSCPRPVCQLVLILLCTFTSSCWHASAARCWSHSYSSPTELCPVPTPWPAGLPSALSPCCYPSHINSASTSCILRHGGCQHVESHSSLLWCSLYVSFFPIWLSARKL